MTQAHLADGTILDFPDETDGAVIDRVVKQHTAPQEPKTDFLSRVGQDYQNRLNEGQQAVDAYKSGKQGEGWTDLDYLGKVGFGTVGDVIGEGINSAASYAPQGVKDAVSSAVHSVSDSPAGDAARYVGGKYQSLAQRYPDAARHVEAAANIGGMLAPEFPIKGTSAAGAVVDAAASGAKGLVSGTGKAAGLANNAVISGLEKVPSIDNALGKTVRPTVQDLAKASQKNYARVAESGEVLSPGFTNSILDHAQGFGIKDEMAAKIAGESPLSKITSDLQEFRDQPMTLERAAAVDQALTDRLEDNAFTDKNGVLNTYGRQLLDIKHNLRDGLLNAVENGHLQISPEAKMLGHGDGAKNYMAAVKDWAAKSQISEIQRIVDRASYMDNPATALKTGFRNIAVNPGRLSKFSPEVQKAIKHAARDGDLANILRTELGSRLISTMTGAAAGSVGGPVGAMVGAGIGAAASRTARNAAESMQMGRVNKVMDAIAGQSSIPTRTIPRSELMRTRQQKLAQEMLKQH